MQGADSYPSPHWPRCLPSAGLSLYVTVLGGSIPLLEDRAVADPTLDRVHDVIDDGGVVDAERLPNGCFDEESNC